jgi:hypothetical protein
MTQIAIVTKWKFVVEFEDRETGEISGTTGQAVCSTCGAAYPGAVLTIPAAPTTAGFNFETAERVYHFVLMPVAPGPRFGRTCEESGGPSRPLPSSSAQEENPRAKRARSIAAKQAGLCFIGIR